MQGYPDWSAKSAMEEWIDGGVWTGWERSPQSEKRAKSNQGHNTWSHEFHLLFFSLHVYHWKGHMECFPGWSAKSAMEEWIDGGVWMRDTSGHPSLRKGQNPIRGITHKAMNSIYSFFFIACISLERPHGRLPWKAEVGAGIVGRHRQWLFLDRGCCWGRGEGNGEGERGRRGGGVDVWGESNGGRRPTLPVADRSLSHYIEFHTDLVRQWSPIPPPTPHLHATAIASGIEVK